MDSYPWEPAQTTSGIVKDPSAGKRVVPQSVRKDGSQRKELRIRDGYVPIEDRIAYKSRGKLESERMKGFIPGATSATPSTYAIPSGKVDPTQGMSKAQKKNYQRKVKRMEEKSARNWDSESEEGAEGGREYEVKRDDSDDEPNDRFDVHRTSEDDRLDAEIDAIEIPELGKKPEFEIGFNKYRDPQKERRKDVEPELKKEKPPRPGGIFRDLGLKPKSSGTTPTVSTATQVKTTPTVSTATQVKTTPSAATEKVKLAPVVTAPKRAVPGAAAAGSSAKAPADKTAPRQRPEVRVRPGQGLAGMMKQLAVQDTTPSVRR
ncbi:hypothetical protein NCC49_004478 [Naganishia albida]|nr:hypothetical protein NCC49_004478 [Naganishia albida]